jgi:hypothetical protein
MFRRDWAFRWSSISTTLFLLAASPLLRGDGVTFEDGIRPLLEAHCFHCHSGPRPKHGLDLRQRRLIVRGGDSGPAVVPEQPNASLLIQRVTRGEMPPGKRAKLSAAEVELLRRWVEAGAPAASDEKPLAAEDFASDTDRDFWAFRPPARPPIPDLACGGSLRSPIDLFVGARLRAEGLDFSAEAEAHTLLRRASFDLLGLPPSLDLMEEFLEDESPAAFERLLDRLLASPRYGERWGRHWLDVAGYADSEGATETDLPRPHAWKYRDYVVSAFNTDLPYDVFLTEQLAGDELARFPGAELNEANTRLLAATGFLRMAADGTADAANNPAGRNQVVADTLRIVSSGILGLTLGCAQCHDHRYDPFSQRDYHRLRAAFDPAFNLERWKPPPARRVSLWTDADRAHAAEVDAQVAAKAAERREREAASIHAVVEKLIAEKVLAGDQEAVRSAQATPEDQRSEEQKAVLAQHPFLAVTSGTLYQYDEKAVEALRKLDAEIAAIAARKPAEDFVRALSEEPGNVPPSRLFVRGDPEQPAEEVEAGVPEVLAPPGRELSLAAAVEVEASELDGLKTSGRRLRLARWLTAPRHPLTSRVFVNRLWLHHFGRGLVATAGDFGTQGEPPSHPEILDWLAVELADGGWTLKRLHRLLMSSAVYRQASATREDCAQRDPEEKLLWRKPLVRLEGEAVRDALLAASGALSLHAGGPPVPVKEDAAGRVVVGADRKGPSNTPGEDVPLGAEAWRRTVYVEVRRTRPLSFTQAFDVPVMETNCTARSASVVATQALTLLNSTFAREQADLFARRLEREAPDDTARIRLGFEIALGRTPTDGEAAQSLEFLQSEAAARGGGDALHAALVEFCQVLFNTSEFITLD